MIYLFEGCKDICSLPAKLCECCKDVCKPCESCFTECSEFFNEFLNRPLGGFVFMAVWLGVIEFGICGYSLYEDAGKDLLKDCKFPEGTGRQVGIHKWLMIQIGFAGLNLIFAPYLQQQIWKKLNEEAKEPDDPNGQVSTRTRLAQSPNGPIRASKQDVMEAFKEVFLYDFFVLVYVLSMAASFVFSYMGNQWIGADKENCNPRGWPEYSAACGMFFVIFMLVYGACWYFTMVCMNSDQTLMLRKGLDVAVAGAAMAGKPIPGAQYLPPAQANANVGRPPQQGGGGGLFGGGKFFGGGQQQAASNSGGGVFGGAPNQPQMSPAAQNSQAMYDGQNAPRPPQPPGCAQNSMKLLACLGLDLMGNATYFLPGLGEAGDAVFAPASAVMLKMMFNSNSVALLGLMEELGPFTDIVPTATIAWFLSTQMPEHPLTKALGLNQEWQMTGDFQR